MKIQLLIFLILSFLNIQTIFAVTELLEKYNESLYSGHYNETRVILSQLNEKYPERIETKLAFANYFLFMYETTKINEKYSNGCKKFTDDAIVKLKEIKNYSNNDVFHIISAKAIQLRIKLLNKNYLSVAKEIGDIIKYFEYALKHSEDTKMKMIAGMYNYHVENAKDDYPIIYPILLFYPSGDKEKGLKMLKECTSVSDKNISIKSMLYLARIYRNDEKIYEKTKYYFEKLLELYPENAVWRHEYIASLKKFGKNKEVEVQKKILDLKLNQSVHLNKEQKSFLSSDLKL